MHRITITLAVVILTALVLSACAGAAPAAPSAPSAPASQPTPSSSGAAAPTQPASANTSGGEMKHDADPMSDNSYDVHFIDSTIEHHAGVLAMAEQALKESQTVALKDLAQKTMATTQREIDWLKAYRQQQHPKAAVMKDKMNMGAMGISTDASKPFDRRYAEAMISHHQGSITMAKEAQTKAGHPELIEFANTMRAAEEAEVAELQQFVK